MAASECCPTTAAMTADGPIVAYRDRSPEEVPDIYITRLDAAAGRTRSPCIQTAGACQRAQ